MRFVVDKVARNMFFSEYFTSVLSVSLFQCCILIHLSITDAMLLQKLALAKGIILV